MRTPIIVGNWKMNKTLADAAATLSALHDSTTTVSGVEFGICAPFPYLAALAGQGTVSVGGQDMFWADSGAFTGFTSAGMLINIGCKYVIIGHSERRGRFGKLEVPESTIPFFAETDETVNLKLKAALKHGLVPIVCVGETLAEREAGNTDSVIQGQMSGALAGLAADDLTTLVIAYEPVWAIGTGKVCDAEEADRVCGVVRACLPAEIQESTRIQYGGSMNPANAAELLAKPNIDGGLVGGASLKAEDFSQVIRAAVV